MDSTFAPIISLLILFGLPQEVSDVQGVDLATLATQSGGVASSVDPDAIFGSDGDQDGITDRLDLCPGTPSLFPVDDNGCTVDTDGDGVSDGMDRCPGTRTKAVAIDNYGCSAKDRKTERSHRYRVRLS